MLFNHVDEYSAVFKKINKKEVYFSRESTELEFNSMRFTLLM